VENKGLLLLHDRRDGHRRIGAVQLQQLSSEQGLVTGYYVDVSLMSLRCFKEQTVFPAKYFSWQAIDE
jgi:hypothetical protein